MILPSEVELSRREAIPYRYTRWQRFLAFLRGLI